MFTVRRSNIIWRDYISKKKKNDELFHSQEYLGTEFDDGLHHWKYVRRYKKGGKWRYVYADKDTHNKISSYNRMARDSEYDEKRYSREFESRYDRYEQMKKSGYDDKKLQEAAWESDSMASLYRTQKDNYLVEASKLINDNSISTLTKPKIDAGKRAVSSVLSKISKTINNIDTNLYNARIDIENKLRRR